MHISEYLLLVVAILAKVGNMLLKLKRGAQNRLRYCTEIKALTLGACFILIS